MTAALSGNLNEQGVSDLSGARVWVLGCFLRGLSGCLSASLVLEDCTHPVVRWHILGRSQVSVINEQHK